jgi:AcrR family transcriptional regulator
VHGPGFEIRTPRDRILAATVRVIADRGYAEATIAEIAAEAFLPAGDVLELVGDKEDCFLAAFSASTQRAYLIALERFTGDAPWPERVRDALAAFLETLAAEPEFVRACTLELPAAGDRALARLGAALEAYTVFLAPGVEARGYAALDAEIIAGGVFHVLHRYAREDRVEHVQEALPELTRVILAPFCAPAEIEAALVPADR